MRRTSRGCARRRGNGASRVPMTTTGQIRRQFEDAGLRIYLYNVNFNETFTDAERDRTFEAARALGAEGFSSSTVLSEARRLVPFVERHKMFVAMHNHNNLVDPDQFATPASFETALAMSPLFQRDARHRPLHRRQQRRGRVHSSAPRPHHQHPRPRPEAEQRPEPAVRPGRHADSPRCFGSSGTTAIRSAATSSTSTGRSGRQLDEVRACFDYCKRVLAS